MAWVTEEEYQAAKQVRAYEYLQTYQPGRLKKTRTRNEWQLQDHDSFKINEITSKWHWKSRGIGGMSALRFLMQVDGMGYTEAVKILCEQTPVYVSRAEPAPRKKPFSLPFPNDSFYRVRRYLNQRGIRDEVLDYCVQLGILYESAPYHNAVFVTLQTDCLYRQDGHPMIQIRQMKTTTFVKPISAELELLIEKAMEYTKKRYGDTVYIFVDEKNSKRPMQYNTVQNKVMDLIQKKDLRDDHGELFGFGTHMFRHVYGIRLTELHLDDWTIAKLLGHTSVKNVKFYRKMSLQIIADETREIRAEMSRMIRANLAGWGKEYEKI